MKVLGIGLDQELLRPLEERGIEIRVKKGLLEEFGFSLMDPECEAVVAKIPHNGWLLSLRQFREEGIHTPVVGIAVPRSLAAWSGYRADFLENGGDDLLQAPADPRELAASLKRVARRFERSPEETFSFVVGGARIDISPSRVLVSVNGARLNLTNTEYRLLMILARQAGTLIPKERIHQCMYSSRHNVPDLEILGVFVCKLRKKLARAHPDARNLIETRWGEGFGILLSQGAAA